MPVLRNPFRKVHQPATTTTATTHVNESTDSFASGSTGTGTGTGTNTLASSVTSDSGRFGTIGRPYLSNPDADRADEVKTSRSSLSIPSRKDKEDENAGYKLSVVNDSGVYLPPSPTEKKSFWRKSNGRVDPPIDRTSLDEPFTISRESFESYRRSFDISARSPVIDATRPSLDGRPRMSLDSRRSRLAPPAKIDEHSATGADDFEEIKLDDAKPKKRGIFSRFGTDATTATTPATVPSSTSALTSGFKFGAKKDTMIETVHESELKKLGVATEQEN